MELGAAPPYLEHSAVSSACQLPPCDTTINQSTVYTTPHITPAPPGSLGDYNLTAVEVLRLTFMCLGKIKNQARNVQFLIQPPDDRSTIGPNFSVLFLSGGKIAKNIRVM